jgi:precorrin-2 methylase
MIILGPKRGEGSIAAHIIEKMSGKGNSHEDMKFDPEKMSKNEESMEPVHLEARKVMEAFKSNDTKAFASSLKSLIEMCLEKKY